VVTRVAVALAPEDVRGDVPPTTAPRDPISPSEPAAAPLLQSRAILRVVEDYVIYPHLIGRDIDLHPLVVILAVLAGVELGGIAGIFIAIPIVALVTVVGRHWLEWRGRDAEGRIAAATPVAETS
jgi:AI-2E family transporter